MQCENASGPLPCTDTERCAPHADTKRTMATTVSQPAHPVHVPVALSSPVER
jgi:hypothetical protein